MNLAAKLREFLNGFVSCNLAKALVLSGRLQLRQLCADVRHYVSAKNEMFKFALEESSSCCRFNSKSAALNISKQVSATRESGDDPLIPCFTFSSKKNRNTVLKLLHFCLGLHFPSQHTRSQRRTTVCTVTDIFKFFLVLRIKGTLWIGHGWNDGTRKLKMPIVKWRDENKSTNITRGP